MTIFSFLQIPEPKSWNHLLWKQGKAFWIQSLSGWAFQKMVLKPPSAQKRMFWAFEKDILQFFADFWVTKLKPFSRKVRQSVQNNSDQNLVIGSFLENDFEASWSLITNTLCVWKEHFSDFCIFLSDEVETVFWESKAKHSKLLKS